MQAIHLIELDTSNPLWGKAKRQLLQTYKKHPFFYEFEQWVTYYFDESEKCVAERNSEFILRMREALGITSQVLFSRGMEIQQANNEMNAEITKTLGGTAYLSGMGADDYQTNAPFHRLGLQLTYTHFDPLSFSYPQSGHQQFIPGLSVLDAIANIGIEGVKMLVGKGKN